MAKYATGHSNRLISDRMRRGRTVNCRVAVKEEEEGEGKQSNYEVAQFISTR